MLIFPDPAILLTLFEDLCLLRFLPPPHWWKMIGDWHSGVFKGVKQNIIFRLDMNACAHIYNTATQCVFCFVWQDTVILAWWFPKACVRVKDLIYLYIPMSKFSFPDRVMLWWNYSVLWITHKCVYLSTVKWPSWQFLLRHAAAWTLGAFV